MSRRANGNISLVHKNFRPAQREKKSEKVRGGEGEKTK